MTDPAQRAKSVKIVLLKNIHSITESRGRGQRNTMTGTKDQGFMSTGYNTTALQHYQDINYPFFLLEVVKICFGLRKYFETHAL